MPEYLEIFDENNLSLQQIKLRRQVHEQGDWHRTAQVYVLNGKNEILCNLRSPLKDVFPLLWDLSFGGHLEPNEAYQDCARRELEEELGITVEPTQLTFITSVKIDGKDEIAHLIDREHAGIFVYQTNLSKEQFNFQKEEIVELAYFSLDLVKANLNAVQLTIPFIPLQKQFLEILNTIEEKLKI